MLDQRNCQTCNAVLLEDPVLPRLPCPACGCLSRNQFAEAEESVEFDDGYRLKQKRPGVKRPVAEERNELSYFVKDGEWHRRYMLVDRINNIYKEVITRHATGEVLLDKDEHLPDHTGHGDDKGPRK